MFLSKIFLFKTGQIESLSIGESSPLYNAANKHGRWTDIFRGVLPRLKQNVKVIEMSCRAMPSRCCTTARDARQSHLSTVRQKIDFETMGAIYRVLSLQYAGEEHMTDWIVRLISIGDWLSQETRTLTKQSGFHSGAEVAIPGEPPWR